MTWKEPKTDWVVNPKNPMAEDFNRIEGNIQALKDDIEIKKGDIVNALQSIGMDVSITDTYEDIANKINAADQGAKVITPGTSNITIPKGFHNGSGYVKGDSNLRSYNIKNGVSIFGVSGSVDTRLKSIEGTKSINGSTTIYTGFQPAAAHIELRYTDDSSKYYKKMWLNPSLTSYVYSEGYAYQWPYDGTLDIVFSNNSVTVEANKGDIIQYAVVGSWA